MGKKSKEEQLKTNKEALDSVCEYNNCYNRENCIKEGMICPAKYALFLNRKIFGNEVKETVCSVENPIQGVN